MKNNKEAVELARYISTFISEYAPSQLTNSDHTLRSHYTSVISKITAALLLINSLRIALTSST